jgi:RNA polymerase sigma factor (sigma-70 family)
MDSQPDLEARDLPPVLAGWARSAAAPRHETSSEEESRDADATPISGRISLAPEAVRRWEQFRDDEDLYLRAALRMLGNRQDAEDLVQEVALRILRHPTGPRDDDCLKAWCFGMVRNAALEFRRSAARRCRADHVDLDYLEGRVDSSHPARETDVDAKRMLAREEPLDDLERELLVRRFVLEQNSTEIALAFQVSPPAVRMKLKRLLVKVRSMLTLVAGYFAITPPP